MLRIYFDWNAMAQLRNPTTEPYISIAKILEENKRFIDLFYSPAHISDLNKKFGESEENDKLTYKDLEFISSFTEDRFMAQYWGEESIKIHNQNPIEYFERHKDDKKEPLRDKMDFTKIIGDDASPEIKALIDQYKSITFTTDFEQMPQAEMEKFNFKFPMPEKGKSMYDYTLEVADYMETIMKDPEVYGNLREIIQNGLSIETKRTANWKNVFSEFDKLLPNTPFCKTLTEHIESNASNNKFSKNVFYDEFLLAYSTLDTFGYKPDELSSKNTHENITNDGLHSFYASHCDFLVTNDKKLKPKSAALYEKYGLLTNICSSSEFLTAIEKYFYVPGSIIEFLKHINSLIIESHKSKRFTITEASEKIPKLETHYFKGLVLKYFNACHAILYIDECICYQLYDTRKRITYHQVEYIINQLVGLLGEDINGLTTYNEDEKSKIDVKGWIGREWKHSWFSLKAHFIDDAFVIGVSVQTNF